MPASERRLPFSTDGLVDEYGQWTVPSYKNEPDISGGAGKRAAVRAGGSASRTSGDQSSTDPGGGFCRNKQRKSHWRIPGGNSKRGHWTADSQEFPSLETRQRMARNTKRSAGPSTAEVDRRPTGPPTPVLRNLDRGMRPAKDFQSVPQKDSNTRTRGVQKTIVTPLSALAENFIPRKTSRKQPTPQVPTDNELDRSFARTGPGKIETPQDIIESDIGTIGAAYPTEIEKPVAVADVAEASGPAVTRACGPVVAGTRFLAVTDVTGASGLAGTGAGGPVITGTRFRAVTDVAGASGPAMTGAGGPVVAGTRFLAVAEVYAPFEETEDDLQGDIREVYQSFNIPEEDAGFRPLEHSGVKKGGRPKNGMTEIDCTAQEVKIVSHPLEHSGVAEWAGVSDGLKKRNLPESLEICTDHCPEDTEDGEAIIVGAVGSAAPWFLTGWTSEVISGVHD